MKSSYVKFTNKPFLNSSLLEQKVVGSQVQVFVIKVFFSFKDVAVDIRGETNGDIVVEYCDMTSLR